MIFTLGKGATTGLSPATEDRNPIELFTEWLADAEKSGLLLPEAATLATCTRDAVPSARMVLLKNVDDRGFVFYTNYDSQKAAELEDNPHAALVFFWPVLQRQVRIEGGLVNRVPEQESRAYFNTRARGSQIGAWASKQSQPLPTREKLTERVEKYNQKFADQDVPLPDFWGGYRITPQSIEFWQGRTDRLHDRLYFHRENDTWKCKRLYP
jgi:pyridoxamine 5'-phosphate oxidase